MNTPFCMFCKKLITESNCSPTLVLRTGFVHILKVDHPVAYCQPKIAGQEAKTNARTKTKGVKNTRNASKKHV